MASTTGFMTGKRGLVTGVLHETSIATSITQSLLREGAECLFTHMPGEKMERRTRKIVEGFGVSNPWLQPMDVASDADISACFERVGKAFEKGQIEIAPPSPTRTGCASASSPRPRAPSSPTRWTSPRSATWRWATPRFPCSRTAPR